MLTEEARWLEETLSALPDEDFPLLNLGSGTRDFRRLQQPHIDQFVFDPLRARGVRVVHSDLQRADGVDLALDFTKREDRQLLSESEWSIRSVLCSNMLEHLEMSPDEAAAHLLDLCPIGGLLLVTVPRRYGYHPDPIDNGYRPSPSQLVSLFTRRADVVTSDVIKGPFLVAHRARDRGLVRYCLRLAAPFYKPREWSGQISWFWCRASVTCVVVRRTS
jgi:hypothetical protein